MIRKVDKRVEKGQMMTDIVSILNTRTVRVRRRVNKLCTKVLGLPMVDKKPHQTVIL